MEFDKDFSIHAAAARIGALFFMQGDQVFMLRVRGPGQAPVTSNEMSYESRESAPPVLLTDVLELFMRHSFIARRWRFFTLRPIAMFFTSTSVNVVSKSQ
jgi:hypothetical protein